MVLVGVVLVLEGSVLVLVDVFFVLILEGLVLVGVVLVLEGSVLVDVFFVLILVLEGLVLVLLDIGPLVFLAFQEILCYIAFGTKNQE